MAELEAIWLKRVRGGPMDAKGEATAVPGRGLVGNANQGGRRQVTLLGAEAWARAEAELGATVDPTARRANLMVRSLELRESRGRVLRVGACRILVGGETRPCRRMDEAHPRLQAALDPEWRAGIYGEVLTGGVIALGDEVGWEPEAVAEGGVPMQ
ncbi:MAG: MOSC domain-containing protein [Thermoanaerobaculia bacterium]